MFVIRPPRNDVSYFHDILYIVQYSLRLLFECYAYFVDVLIYTQRGKGFHDLRTNVLMYPDFLDT